MKLADGGRLKGEGTFMLQSFSFGELLFNLICAQRWTRGTLGRCLGSGCEGCCAHLQAQLSVPGNTGRPAERRLCTLRSAKYMLDWHRNEINENNLLEAQCNYSDIPSMIC